MNISFIIKKATQLCGFVFFAPLNIDLSNQFIEELRRFALLSMKLKGD